MTQGNVHDRLQAVHESPETLSNKRRGEFGPSDLVGIDRKYINILPQIRKTFDATKLKELADSFSSSGEDPTGTIHYGMMEAPEVGWHTPESATIYLHQFNFSNGTAFTLDDLLPMPVGSEVSYIILIAGERRIRASDIVANADKLDEQVINCSPMYNISYVDALPRQFIENNARVNPPATEEARAIRAHIDMIRQLDPRYTNKKCAEMFGVNPDKIADAITFTDYHPAMQALAETYPYSLVVEARNIYDIWRKYHEEQNDYGKGSEGYASSDGTLFFDTSEEVAAHEVETCFLNLKAEQLRRRRDPHGKKRDLSLKAQEEAIYRSMEQESLGFSQGAFETLEVDDNYWTRRAFAAQRLFEAALQGVELLSRIGALSPDMIRRLGQYGSIESVEITSAPSLRIVEQAVEVA